MADWFDITEHFHSQTFDHDCRLAALSHDWQRELAALWRLEADVNNGGYLQFLVNWGPESHRYAAQGLQNIGAHRMKEIIDRCHSLIGEHVGFTDATEDTLQQLMPNKVMGLDGTVVKEEGSSLPDVVLQEVQELSFEFMDYPEDVESLGMEHYADAIRSAGME